MFQPNCRNDNGLQQKKRTQEEATKESHREGREEGLRKGRQDENVNRLWQLQHALPFTLLHCWGHRSYTKVSVVDFGNTHGTLRPSAST